MVRMDLRDIVSIQSDDSNSIYIYVRRYKYDLLMLPSFGVKTCWYRWDEFGFEEVDESELFSFR